DTYTVTTASAAAIYTSLAAWQGAAGITGALTTGPGAVTNYTANTAISMGGGHTFSPSVAFQHQPTWDPANHPNGTWLFNNTTTMTLTFSPNPAAIFFVFESWDTLNTHAVTVTTNTGLTLTQTQAVFGALSFGIYNPAGFTSVTISCPDCVHVANDSNGFGLGAWRD
ncbi:MAG: hypothetical protein OEZ28_12635, partial [Nitrospinota bacterium]|nr:hypothetical protein [Nitrospinota bacterium]